MIGKIILGIAAGVVIVAAGAFAAYWDHIHWYDKYEQAIKQGGAEEKQAVLPSGSVINYGEVANDKPTLLLIHGQMSTWEDYALAPGTE